MKEKPKIWTEEELLASLNGKGAKRREKAFQKRWRKKGRKLAVLERRREASLTSVT